MIAPLHGLNRKTFRTPRYSIRDITRIAEETTMNAPFAFLNLNPMEIIFLLGLGVLLFGRNLPQVGRSLGRTLVEFKKSFAGMEEEISNPGSQRYDSVPMEQPRPPQRVQTTAPKFEDPSIAANADANGSATNITTTPPA
jgi:sec-independent protein translocase protein TatA